MFFSPIFRNIKLVGKMDVTVRCSWAVLRYSVFSACLCVNSISKIFSDGVYETNATNMSSESLPVQCLHCVVIFVMICCVLPFHFQLPHGCVTYLCNHPL